MDVILFMAEFMNNQKTRVPVPIKSEVNKPDEPAMYPHKVEAIVYRLVRFQALANNFVQKVK
jgi:hypothetical protein